LCFNPSQLREILTTTPERGEMKMSATRQIKGGDTITFRKLSFRNVGGGTEQARTKAPIPGTVTAVVNDSECGSHIHCEPSLAVRLMFGERQHATDKRVFVSEFDVLYHADGKR
jgi:hypothetical protein